MYKLVYKAMDICLWMQQEVLLGDQVVLVATVVFLPRIGDLKSLLVFAANQVLGTWRMETSTSLHSIWTQHQVLLVKHLPDCTPRMDTKGMGSS